MNSNFLRSFFLAATLVVAALITGCAGSGGLQGQARIPFVSNGQVGQVMIGGQGSNSIYAPQQQQVQYQPQQQQACPAGQQLWNFSDGSRPCYGGSQQPQYQQQPQQPQYQQQQPQYQPQPNWCGDTCNQSLRSQVIPAPSVRYCNFQDMYGRPVQAPCR